MGVGGAQTISVCSENRGETVLALILASRGLAVELPRESSLICDSCDWLNRYEKTNQNIETVENCYFILFVDTSLYFLGPINR